MPVLRLPAVRRRELRIVPHGDAYADARAAAYAAGGRPAIVQDGIRGALQQPHAAASLQLALLYGEAGEMNEAFRHLDRAIERRDPSLVHLAVSLQWDVLRGDPRFAERLTQMGLAGCES